MTGPAISVTGLWKNYQGKERSDNAALKGISFEVEQGEVFGFIGPNGAGKTTTIRVLATVIPPDAGEVVIGGYGLMNNKLEIQHLVGLMPEAVSFYPTLSGIEHLLLYSRYYRLEKPRNRAQELLSLVGLREASDTKLRGYSHGMRRRLALAQCLLHNPSVLLLDEPAGGLDPEGIRFFRNLVVELRKQGKTIFLSSHQLSEVELIADRVAVIHRGTVLECDSIERLAQRFRSSQTRRLSIRGEGFTETTMSELRDVAGIVQVGGSAFDLNILMRADSHLTVELTTRIFDILRKSGARVQSYKTEERVLEEIFFSLTERVE